MPYAEVGVRLWYEEFGDAGTPVLLIMGLSFPGRVWTPQAEELRVSHRVVHYDNRGIGKSQRPSGIYSIEQMAEDAHALLEHLGWRRAHVVGASMGGMIAQELALHHPERVLSLGLVATHAGGWLPRAPTLEGQRWLLKANRRRGRERIAAVARSLFPPEVLERPEAERLLETLRSWLGDEPPLAGTLKQLAGVMRHDTSRRLGKLASIPTLIFKPERDLIIRPHESDRLHRRIPGSRLIAFPDAGHGITGQCTAEVNRLLLEHFAAAEATPS